jgi:flagellar biosynthesis/type III secretory pathway M-ring protein FliF/YscJ
MDSAQLIWLIVVIVAILVVLGLVLWLGRRKALDQHREKAAELRQSAQNDELSAREREAESARAQADAKQAEVDAERLRREADERQREAESARSRSDERVREANSLDPDTDVRGIRRDADDEVESGQARHKLERDYSGQDDSSQREV